MSRFISRQMRVAKNMIARGFRKLSYFFKNKGHKMQ